MSTLVQVIARVAKLYNKTTCTVDVHLLYSDGTTKKFDKGNVIVLPRSALPSMYLYANHYCDPSKIEDGIPTRFNLSILKTVLDPESTIPQLSHRQIAALVKNHARWLWSKEDERWNYTTDQCITDMNESPNKCVKSNEDFCNIAYPSIRKAAYEILGRPYIETAADRIPVLTPAKISAALGPNAGILAVALAGGVLPPDMETENTLAVSPCKATAEYFTFYSALPAVSYQVFMSGSHTLRRAEYIIIDRCAAYTERELHSLLSYLKKESSLKQLFIMVPTPVLRGIAQTYYRGCIIIDPPPSSFVMAGKPPARCLTSRLVGEFFQKTDSSSYRAGDCVSSAVGELVIVKRVAEIVSGFPVIKDAVGADDPASRFFADGAACMFPRAGHRVGYFTAGPIAAETVDEVLRMACVSLPGECYLRG